MADLDENLNPDQPQFPPMPNFLKRVLGLNGNKKEESIGALSAEEVKLWNELREAGKLANESAARHTSLHKLFWGTIECNHKCYDRTMRIDESMGLVMAEIPEKEGA